MPISDKTTLTSDEKLVLASFIISDNDKMRVDGICRSDFVRHSNSRTAQLCWRTCESLVSLGALKCVTTAMNVAMRWYELQRPFPFPLVREVVLHAAKCAPSTFSYEQEAFMLTLVSGGKGPAIAKMPSWVRRSFWEVAVWFAFQMSVTDKLPPFSFPSQTDDSVFRILASVLFCRGIDITPLLENWRANLVAKRGFKGNDADSNAMEFSALCVWTGHADWIGSAVRVASPSSLEFAKGCIALAAGDIAAAFDASDVIDNHVARSLDDRDSRLASMPASHLLALTLAAFHKPVRTRLSRLVGKFRPVATSTSSEFSYGARSFINARLGASKSFTSLSDTPGYSVFRTSWLSPVCSSGDALAAVAFGMAGEYVKENRAQFFHQAELALANGYPTLAGVYLSAFSWVFTGDTAKKAADLAERVTAAGGIWFRPYTSSANSWKMAIDAFAKCLPAAPKASARAEKAKGGRIVWHIQIRHVDADDTPSSSSRPSLFKCSDIAPCFRGPRAASDGSGDKPVSFRVMDGGKHDAILTETDRAVLAAVHKTKFDKQPSYYSTEVAADVLAPLCGHDAVMVDDYDDDKGASKSNLVTLERRDIPLAVKSAPDGGLTLSVPEWCLDQARDYILAQEQEGILEFYPLPKAAAETLSVFSSYGSDGRIDIPKEGVADIQALLPRMGALAPIQGELSVLGGGANLARVNGDPTPLVRLEYGDEGLAIALCVRPLESSRDLVFIPGSGQPERLVADKRGSVVIVRDLAAEAKAAATVRGALGDFGAWASGENDWIIDDLLHALRALDALKALGKTIHLEWRKGRKLAVSAPVAGKWKLSAVGGADFWFSVAGQFPLDDGKAISIASLLDAYRNRKGEFLPFGDNEYLRLSSAMMKRLEALDAAGRVKGGSLQVPPAALPMLDGAFGDDEDDTFALPQSMEERAAAVRDALSRKVEPPSRLTGELRPYQRDGYEWLSRLASAGMGACLADDMGLGKTIQVIALLLERAADGASLVIAPASVCGNWRNELNRFAPTLRPIMAWDEKADAMKAVHAAGPGDIVIAGYGLLVAREDSFVARDWNGVVLDEAQAIKNETSKRAHAAKKLHARFRVAATGTPVENRLTELWSISDFLNPGLLGKVDDFTRRFTSDGRATPALKRLVSPLVLRRLKGDVLEDLPEKTEITLPIDLGKEERDGYETCRRLALEALSGGAGDNRISILAELTRLRRYCCHPSLVLGPEARESAKMDALVELLGDLRENRHRALVFSQFTDYLALVRRAVDDAGWTHLYLDGQTPAAERGRLVDAFQRGEGDFFLISLKAGGTGLNLTAANYVILLDPWWNPAVENQAADRVHRIGQKNPVTVYRLIAADTVEERVLELHREKKAIAEDVLEDASASALTPDELLSLFN